MTRHAFGLLLFVLLVFSLGCQVQNTSEGSRISVQFPSVQDWETSHPKMKGLSQKGSLSELSSTIDYSRLCFYANVRGPGIGESQQSCFPTKGVFSGGVGPGQNIELEVPSGPSRVAEIYGGLRTNNSIPCSNFAPTADQLFFLGQSEPTEVQPPSATMDVTIQLPSATQNLADLNGWTTCPRAPPSAITSNSIGRAQLGSGVHVGTDHKISSQVSLKNEGQTQTGTNFKIRSWIKKGEEP